MKSYFVPHKLKPGDITHLSDSSSELIISAGTHKIEDPIVIQTPEGYFVGRITFLDTASVEVEVLQPYVESTGDNEGANAAGQTTIIQSISNDPKFNFFVEKAVELGVYKIIPIESRYSLITKNEALKRFGLWQKVISDASEQSRNQYPPTIEKPIRIDDLHEIEFDTVKCNKVCLTSEPVMTTSFEKQSKEFELDKPIFIAIGPEKGWSSTDIEVFKSLDFNFCTFGRNILRTETAGIIAAGIINFLRKTY